MEVLRSQVEEKESEISKKKKAAAEEKAVALEAQFFIGYKTLENYLVGLSTSSLHTKGVSASTAAEMVDAWKRVCPNFKTLKESICSKFWTKTEDKDEVQLKMHLSKKLGVYKFNTSFLVDKTFGFFKAVNCFGALTHPSTSSQLHPPTSSQLNVPGPSLPSLSTPSQLEDKERRLAEKELQELQRKLEEERSTLEGQQFDSKSASRQRGQN